MRDFFGPRSSRNHRQALGIFRHEVPRYWRHPMALLRSAIWRLVVGDIVEKCDRCSRHYPYSWHAPQPLWNEVNGRYAGALCPQCFNRDAKAAGYMLCWTPMVIRKDGVATTNWWGDPIRDRLLMGEPDPHFHDDELAQVPQGDWGYIALSLGWPYETPYPDENRSDRVSDVTYVDSGVNAEAESA